jgi:hypothetical protein
MTMLDLAPAYQISSGFNLAREYRGGYAGSAESFAFFPGSDVGQQLQSELNGLVEECSSEDWDGHGASRISPNAYDAAKRFIQGLPGNIERPILAADPDGCVTFEWSLSPKRMVWVSVHPDYRIDYAAIFGSEKLQGTAPFFDTAIPRVVQNLTRRVFHV